MAIWSIKSSLRLQVISYRQSSGDAFLEEMRAIGVPFSLCKNEKSLLGKLQKDVPLLLLEPTYGEPYTNDFGRLLQQKEEPVFILSADHRWKELSKINICYYLPADTHPLELARLLVEKLNLPAVSNKPSYAFSFFQF